MAHLNRKISIPSFDLTGKTAIITGGTQGLGFGIACALAAYGANVVITARTAAKVEDAAADLNENYCKGGRALGIPADSSKQENVKAVIEQTVAEFGSLDILINNAGISGDTALIVETREGRKEYTVENFRKVIETNLTGTFMFCQEAARQMIKQNAENGKKGGRIIITSSVGGFIGGKGVVGYGASKAACLSLARTMANNFGRENITVNCICPGYVVTPLNEEFFIDADGNQTAYYKQQAKATSVRRLGTIEEIAGPVLAMCSDSFSYMTGTYLLVDGGQSIPAE
jgi:3-oxoacyl-[acyl-carrier protein] reductase